MRISPSIGKRGPRVAILGGHLGQRGGDVQFGDGRGGGADALRVRGGELAHLGEDLASRASRIFSSASRTLRSYSFSSGVVKRSALTSVCLRS